MIYAVGNDFIQPNRRNLLIAVSVVVLSTLAPSVGASPVVPPGYMIEQVDTGAFPLIQPDGLAVDANGTIYVGRNFLTNPSSSDILRITTSGEVTPIASFPTFIGGLTLDSNGTLFGS